MSKKQATRDESEYMGRVAALGCYLCRHLGYGPTPAQVHHISYGKGMSQRNSHYLTIPLCDTHHANASVDGIHGQRRAWKLASVDEMDGLADTIKLLN